MRSEWSDGKAHGDDVGPGSDSRRLIARMSDPEDEDKEFLNRAWWCMAIIPVTQEAKAEAHKVEASLGTLTRPCIKNKEYLHRINGEDSQEVANVQVSKFKRCYNSRNVGSRE